MPQRSNAALAVELFVGAAKAFRNMGEVGKRQNTGYVVDWFLKRTSLNPGYPWCMAFVSHVGYEGLYDEFTNKSLWPLPLTASCWQLGDWVRKKHPEIIVPNAEAARGHIFLSYYPELEGGRFGHTGIILGKRPTGKQLTIEGNTNDDGSREGWKVCYKDRTFKEKDMIIDWTKLL